VQRVADKHFEFFEVGDELSTAHYPICASQGEVRKHTDEFDGEEEGKRIFGYVVRSDGHMLHSHSLCGDNADCRHGACLSGIELITGDIYGLDPMDPHWTTCRRDDDQLIFLATFLEYGDDRFDLPKKIAHDLKWETIKASVEAERLRQQEIADDKIRYRGIGE
jgi:hypothetical protein